MRRAQDTQYLLTHRELRGQGQLSFVNQKIEIRQSEFVGMIWGLWSDQMTQIVVSLLVYGVFDVVSNSIMNL